MRAEVDKEQWSESSKQSYAYQSGKHCYEDIHYTCRKCGLESVFPGEEQKVAFEVKKQYIWKRRVLCPDCNGKLFALRVVQREFEARWAAQRNELRRDLNFLRAWQEVLAAFPGYGSRVGGDMGKRIARLVAELEGHE